MGYEEVKLPVKEKVGYALGDMAANFVFQAMLALQLSFYTDTFGLTAAQAGTLFLVVGLGAAAINPVMGIIADRTNTRWGKFRPWILWTAVPFGIIGIFTFSTPSLSPGGKLLYAWTTYILLRLIYVMNNVPYASLTAVITGDPDERTSISSYRQFAANTAGFIVQSLAIPMVIFFGGTDPKGQIKGYQITMGLLSVLAIVFFVVTFATTKERIQPDPKQKSSTGQDLADLFRNRSWVALFVVTTFYFIAVSLRSSVMLPFFKYVAGDQGLFAWFNGFGLASLLIGVACSNFMAVRMGKRNLFILSMALVAIFNAALLFIPSTATVPIFISEILRQFSFGCSCPLLWAMIADVADFGEWKTGRRASGTVTSAVVFALWAGLALGGAIGGWLFSAYGYVANEIQTPRALLGIKLTASLWSGLAFALTAVCLVFYPITRELNQKIAEELAERRRKYA